MKPGIGILINALSLGGAEKQSLLQAKVMKDEYPVFYFVQLKKPRLQQHLDFIHRENIKYIQLSGGFIKRVFLLVSHLKRNNIKVLYAYLTLDNALAACCSVFYRIKYAGGIRNSHLPYSKYLANKVVQRFFLDRVIYNNYHGRDMLVKKGFSSKKSIVIHNCIDSPAEVILRPVKKTAQILSVGRFCEQKDFYTALSAIKLLQTYKDLNCSFTFTIIGEGELENQIKKWITDLDLANVNLVILPDNLNEYYINADIYLMTSLFEGIPNTIMEALNFSLPVISTDIGDASYLVKDGVNGFLTRKRDVESIAGALAKLINDHALRNAFGKAGHDLLVRDFTMEKFKSRYMQVTDELLQ